MLENQGGFYGIPKADRRSEGDPQQRQPDITRAREILGYEPKVSLEEGLKQTIAFFKAEMGLS